MRKRQKEKDNSKAWMKKWKMTESILGREKWENVRKSETTNKAQDLRISESEKNRFEMSKYNKWE